MTVGSARADPTTPGVYSAAVHWAKVYCRACGGRGHVGGVLCSACGASGPVEVGCGAAGDLDGYWLIGRCSRCGATASEELTLLSSLKDFESDHAEAPTPSLARDLWLPWAAAPAVARRWWRRLALWLRAVLADGGVG